MKDFSKRSLLFLFLSVACLMQGFAQTTEWKKMRYGNQAFRSRNYNKAADCYQDILRQNPQNPYALFNMADVYLTKGDAVMADSLFEQVTRFSSSVGLKARAYHNRGVIRQKSAAADPEKKQQLLRDAIEQYKQSLRLNPHDENTRYNLALCQKQLKNDKNQNQPKPQPKPQPQPQPQKQNEKPQPKDQKNQPYYNLVRQAEAQTLEKLKKAQPRQRQQGKNW